MEWINNVPDGEGKIILQMPNKSSPQCPLVLLFNTSSQFPRLNVPLKEVQLQLAARGACYSSTLTVDNLGFVIEERNFQEQY